jgi:hypothetical protein
MPSGLHNVDSATSFRLAECQVGPIAPKPEWAGRFEAKVRRGNPSDCWLWTSSSMNGRYGGFWADGKPQYAHRLAFILAHGPIPAGLSVLHDCDVPMCVNPSHLFLGTQTDNMRDASQKGRLAVPRVANRARIAEIRRRWLSGESQADLAKAFGVHRVQICRWIKAVRHLREVAA